MENEKRSFSFNKESRKEFFILTTDCVYAKKKYSQPWIRTHMCKCMSVFHQKDIQGRVGQWNVKEEKIKF